MKGAIEISDRIKLGFPILVRVVRGRDSGQSGVPRHVEQQSENDHRNCRYHGIEQYPLRQGLTPYFPVLQLGAIRHSDLILVL
jgi:hypothetical protein